jgi:hypothetical protein
MDFNYGRKDDLNRSFSSSDERRDEDRAFGNGNSNGFGEFPRGQSQAPSATVFPTTGPTAKRGSKACVACTWISEVLMYGR